MTEEQKSVVVTELANASKRITTQFSSGRWLLTMASAVCVVMMVYADCRVAMKQATAGIAVLMPFDITAILTIVATVFTSYFHVNKENGSEGA